MEKALNKISNNLEAKLNESFTILNHTRFILTTYFNAHNLQSALFPCSKSQNVLTEYEIFNLQENISNTYSEGLFNVNHCKYCNLDLLFYVC